MEFIELADNILEKEEEDAHDMRKTQDQDDLSSSGSFVQSFQEFAELAERNHMDTDEVIASIIAMADSFREDDEEEDKKDKTTSLLAKFCNWVVKKLSWAALRLVVRSVWSLLTWFVEDILVGGLRYIGSFVLRSVLLECGEFAILTPEVWIPLALAGGAAAFVYFLYKKFFSEDTPVPDDLAKAMTEHPETTHAPTAAIPEAAGETVGIQRMTTGQLLRQGVSTRAESLEALIGRGEGSYNSVNLGATHGYKAATIDLEHMTVAEVMRHQQNRDFNAAGRYQIIKDTLAGAVQYLRLTGNELFDRQTQDLIFENYLIGVKKSAIADYIHGKSDDINAAILAASHEWASVAVPPGLRTKNGSISDGTISYYTGIANNRASITAFEMARVLQQERSKYLGQTAASASTSVPTGVSMDVPGRTIQSQAQPTGSAGAPMTSGTTSSYIVTGPMGVPIKLNG
jgi:hypothetical protein